MRKNNIVTFGKTGFFILSLAFVFLLGAKSSGAAVRFGFLVNGAGYPKVGSWRDYFEGSVAQAGVIDNINFNNIDASPLFSSRIKNATEYWPASFYAKGELYIPADGNYEISVLTDSGGGKMSIFDSNHTAVCNLFDTPLYCPSAFYAQGHYTFYFQYRPSDLAVGPRLKLVWRTPFAAGINPIPAANLSAIDYDQTEIRIPSGANTTAKMDYLVSGTGVDTSVFSGNPAEIKFQLPAGVTDSNIMKSDVWISWVNSNNNSNLSVKNEKSGVVSNISGNWFKTPNLSAGQELRTKIPASLISADAGGEIHLSFAGLDSEYLDGIAVVLPYIDNNKPEGYLRIKMGERLSLGITSHPITFDDLSSNIDLGDLRPFFILRDGSSLQNPATEKFRSNYISYKAGPGAMPGEGDFFGEGNMFLPEIPQPMNASLPDLGVTKASWYPNFGREGGQLDVLAKTGNYAPNLATGSNAGGVLDFLSPPSAGTDWISFQYNTSSFIVDQSTTTKASLAIESGGFLMAGLLVYEKQPKMIICPDNSVSSRFSLSQGIAQKFEARYWSVFSGIPDCSSLGYTDVAGEASTIWTPQNVNVSMVPGFAGHIRGDNTGDADVKVDYTDALGNNLTSFAYINVTNGAPSCTFTSCDTSNNKCVSTTNTLFPCPASTCDMSDPNSCEDKKGWKEVNP